MQDSTFSFLNAKFQPQIVQDSTFLALNAKFQPRIVQDSTFSSLNAKFQLRIVQDSTFSSLNAKSQPQIVQKPPFPFLKCKISSPNCAETILFLLNFLSPESSSCQQPFSSSTHASSLSSIFCYTKETEPSTQKRKNDEACPLPRHIPPFSH